LGATRPAIEADGLAKHFRVYRHERGMLGVLRGLFRREFQVVRALGGVTFTVGEGEIVALVGPNGAGKTTLLKCVAGVLRPTAGSIRALGHVPHVREPDYLGRMTFVTGQRNQLMWDLPAMQSFLVNQAIYGIPTSRFRSVVDELVALLDLGALLDKQVRKLSLGERMRCELAASLLHEPKLLLLDEPTLGLDIHSQVAIREFLRLQNRQRGTTVILSSHYMGDVTALAGRVLLIDRGELLFDGSLKSLTRKIAPYKLLRITVGRRVNVASLVALGTILESGDNGVVLRVPTRRVRQAAMEAFARFPIADIVVQDPPLEDVIRDFFRRNARGTGTPVTADSGEAHQGRPRGR